jgi:hypothetical protein
MAGSASIAARRMRSANSIRKFRRVFRTTPQLNRTSPPGWRLHVGPVLPISRSPARDAESKRPFPKPNLTSASWSGKILEAAFPSALGLENFIDIKAGNQIEAYIVEGRLRPSYRRQGHSAEGRFTNMVLLLPGPASCFLLPASGFVA